MPNPASIHQPAILPEILRKSHEIAFSMPSDERLGPLLRTLVASRPDANILELGTGTGLALAWMADGMHANASLTSIDNDPDLVSIAQGFFEGDPRVRILEADGATWLQNYTGRPFDLIFADAWPGKYSELDQVLGLVKPGGFYIVDDMLAQPNWPEGHDQLAAGLISRLGAREDFHFTWLNWSTGIILMCRK